MSLFEGNLWGRAGKRKPQNFGIQTHLKGESRLRLEQPSQSRRQDTNTSAFPTFRVFLFQAPRFPPHPGSNPNTTGLKAQGCLDIGKQAGWDPAGKDTNTSAFPTFWVFLFHSSSFPPMQGQIPTGVGSELLVLWVWTWGTRQDRILLGITALPTFWIFLSCSCSLLPPHPR